MKKYKKIFGALRILFAITFLLMPISMIVAIFNSFFWKITLALFITVLFELFIMQLVRAAAAKKSFDKVKDKIIDEVVEEVVEEWLED